MLWRGSTRVRPEEAHVRNRGVLLLALAIAAVLAAGSAVALIQAGDDPKVGALPTASPTASQTPTQSPTPSPSATESATPEPTASQAPSATPRATRSATARPTSGGSTTYSYPKPSTTYPGLQLTITATSQDDDPTEYTLVAQASDGDGRIYFNGLSWGDGTTQPAAANPQRCKNYPPLTSPPGAYQPENDSKQYTFTHRYAPGSYVITVQVASVNGDCRPNGPKREDRLLRVRINVPSPAPTPTP